MRVAAEGPESTAPLAVGDRVQVPAGLEPQISHRRPYDPGNFPVAKDGEGTVVEVDAANRTARVDFGINGASATRRVLFEELVIVGMVGVNL